MSLSNPIREVTITHTGAPEHRRTRWILRDNTQYKSGRRGNSYALPYTTEFIFVGWDMRPEHRRAQRARRIVDGLLEAGAKMSVRVEPKFLEVLVARQEEAC